MNNKMESQPVMANEITFDEMWSDLKRENPKFFGKAEKIAALLRELAKLGVDVAEVVHCKDCERRNKSADLTDTVLCPWLHNLSMPKDGFCSYGERKEGANHE